MWLSASKIGTWVIGHISFSQISCSQVSGTSVGGCVGPSVHADRGGQRSQPSGGCCDNGRGVGEVIHPPLILARSHSVTRRRGRGSICSTARGARISPDSAGAV